MKVAFHFDGDHPGLGGAYGAAARRLVFGALLSLRRVHVNSKVFVGDLLFSEIDGSRDGRQRSFTRPLTAAEALDFWVRPEHPVWFRLSDERVNALLGHCVYAICLDSIHEAPG